MSRGLKKVEREKQRMFLADGSAGAKLVRLDRASDVRRSHPTQRPPTPKCGQCWAPVTRPK